MKEVVSPSLQVMPKKVVETRFPHSCRARASDHNLRLDGYVLRATRTVTGTVNASANQKQPLERAFLPKQQATVPDGKPVLV